MKLHRRIVKRQRHARHLLNCRNHFRNEVIHLLRRDTHRLRPVSIEREVIRPEVCLQFRKFRERAGIAREQAEERLVEHGGRGAEEAAGDRRPFGEDDPVLPAHAFFLRPHRERAREALEMDLREQVEERRAAEVSFEERFRRARHQGRRAYTRKWSGRR